MSSVAINALNSEQLESYLLSLTPAAARFLIREVELDRLKGGHAYEHELILKYARRALQLQRDHFDRVGTPLRILCEPFADLLVDSTTAKKQHGRIARSSILPMWRWLTEDVAPKVLEPLTRDLSLALIERNEGRISNLTHQFHAVAAEAISSALDGLEADSKSYLRVSTQIGSARILEDVIDIAGLLGRASVLLGIRERLPAQIDALGKEEAASIITYYNQIAESSVEDAQLMLLVLTSRLRRPSEVVRIVTDLCRSESDSEIRSTPMALVCDCLLHDMEVAALGALQAITSRAPMELTKRFLTHFFEVAEGFVGLMDVDMKGAWGQRIIAIRNALSTNIRSELEDCPRLVKSALYGRKRRSGGSIAWPDPKAIEEAAYGVRLMLSVRPYLSQIPINSDFATIQSTVIGFIESIGEITIEDIRRNEGEAQSCAEAYMSSVVDFNEMVFGREAAELLRRRARVAAQQGTAT